MLHKALVLVFVVAGVVSCLSCGTTASHYVYATVPDANQIFAYREDPNTGILTLLAGSPYPAGDGATSAVLHPSGKFLYAANPGQLENDISLFDIGSDGVLTEVTPRTSIGINASQPEFLAMDPSGNYLYVANTGSDNISVFSIDSSTGALTLLANSPTVVGLTPLNMQVTPSGNLLYVTTSGQSDGDGFIFGFSVNAGVLTSLGAPSSSFGEIPNGLAIDPSGTYLYTANAGSSNTIAVFSISSSGALSLVSGTPLADGYATPVSLVFDPKGANLYVANQGSGNVEVYSISSTTGLPTLLTSSTNTGAFFTEGSPSVLAVDPNGGYLFVGNQGSGAAVQAFSVSSGNLTNIFTYRVGNTPSSIVVLK